MQQLSLCPGSFALEKEMGEPETDNQYAKWGSLIAAYIEAVRTKRHNKPSMNLNLQEMADACLAKANQAIEDIRGHIGAGAYNPADEFWSVEIRLWGNTQLGHRYSGRFDLGVLNKTAGIGIIVDDKSGWGDIPPASENLQLRTLAVLAYKHWRVNNIFVVLNQPSKGKPSVAHYGLSELIAAEGEIESYVNAAYTPGADRRPSAKACKFCSAKIFCKEAMEVFTKTATGEIAGDWALALDQLEVTELVAKDLKAKAKQALAANPKAIPGWHLKEGYERTSITDPKGAFGRLSDTITSEDFMSCCTVKIGELATAFQKRAGIRNKKVARTGLEDRLSGLLDKKKSEPSLERVGSSEKEAE
jgi:hypothetical protein